MSSQSPMTSLFDDPDNAVADTSGRQPTTSMFDNPQRVAAEMTRKPPPSVPDDDGPPETLRSRLGQALPALRLLPMAVATFLIISEVGRETPDDRRREVCTAKVDSLLALEDESMELASREELLIMYCD